MMMTPGIITEPTVYVVDDDPAIRDSLHGLITSVDLRVETFAQTQQFLDAYDPDTPGCLLLDIRMPRMSGLELMKIYSEKFSNLPVIIITGHSDVELAVRAMKLGAFDFIEKPIKNEPLLELIQMAIKKSSHILTKRIQGSPIRERFGLLTDREQDILALLMTGDKNKLIATKLCISERTVEVHRANLMRKMHADSLAHLFKMCMILGQDK